MSFFYFCMATQLFKIIDDVSETAIPMRSNLTQHRCKQVSLTKGVIGGYKRTYKFVLKGLIKYFNPL